MCLLQRLQFAQVFSKAIITTPPHAQTQKQYGGMLFPAFADFRGAR